mgnify:CR=1 FL=1
MRDSTAPNRPITQKDVAERAGVGKGFLIAFPLRQGVKYNMIDTLKVTRHVVITIHGGAEMRLLAEVVRAESHFV